MQNQKLLNKVITISSEETKQAQFGLVKKIKDEKGLTYSIFQTKQDGSESAAWQQYKELNLGDTVQIGYVEKIKQTPDGKGYTARTIRNFNKDIGEGVQRYQGSQEQKIPRSEAPVRSQSQSKDTDWDQIAVGKCQTQFLAAYIQSGKTIEDAKLQVVKARKLAELVVYGAQQEELPTINQDDDPAGDFNPMVNDEPPIEAYDDIPY